MNDHHHSHDHHSTTAGGPPPYFTEAEWEEFHHEDVKAGKAIVVLMSGIFTIGLFLYMAIAFMVME